MTCPNLQLDPLRYEGDGFAPAHALHVAVRDTWRNFLRVKAALKEQCDYLEAQIAVLGVPAGAADHGALLGLADDDHPQYALTDGSRGDFETMGAVAAHVTAGDPHTGYQKESEKAAANGYASLDAGTLVPFAQLGTGGATGSKFLRDDRSWQVPPGASEIAMSRLTQTTSITITAGYGAVIPRKVAIDSGVIVTISSGARMRIL